jgi:Spy/CpxP family protein refolding chaperone
MSFFTFNQQKTLTWVLILLSSLNLFFFVRIYLDQPEQDDKSIGLAKYPKKKIKKIRSRIQSDLKLTEEQTLAFKELQERHQQKVFEIFKRKNELKALSFRELSELESDKLAIDSINKSLSNLQFDLENMTTEHFLSIKKMLTTEQLPYFAKFIKRMGHFGKPRMKFKKPY